MSTAGALARVMHFSQIVRQSRRCPELRFEPTRQVRHAAQLPAMADDGVLEPVKQPASVRIVADDLLPGVAPRHHVTNGALEFDPQSSWHFGWLDARKLVVKLKTKNKV